VRVEGGDRQIICLCRSGGHLRGVGIEECWQVGIGLAVARVGGGDRWIAWPHCSGQRS
jgi:hypothetical protein